MAYVTFGMRSKSGISFSGFLAFQEMFCRSGG